MRTTVCDAYGKWGGWRSSARSTFPPALFSIYKPFKLDSLFKDKAFLHQKYSLEKLSCQEIAKEISSSRTTVLKWLKIFEIPVRRTREGPQKSSLPYGKKMIQRSEVNFVQEQSNILKMKELRSQGFSYWKIADILNTMKIPTKTSRGRWQARTVQRILDSTLPSNVI